MATRTITVSAKIPVAASRAYAIIADYESGHPNILTPEFTTFAVERGGIGAGTVIRFEMMIFGRKRIMRAIITEPEPGRVLVETGLDAQPVVTTFIVDPDSDPEQCHVTFTTELPVRDGFLGLLEGYFGARYLRPIYTRELRKLAEFAPTYARKSQVGRPA